MGIPNVIRGVLLAMFMLLMGVLIFSSPEMFSANSDTKTDFSSFILPETDPDPPGAATAPPAPSAPDQTPILASAPTHIPITPRKLPSFYLSFMFLESDILHCLAKGSTLRGHNSSLGLICGYHPSISAAIPEDWKSVALTKFGVHFIEAPSFWTPSWGQRGYPSVPAKWAASWNRFGFFGLEDYEALIYTDLDVVLLRHVDELVKTVTEDLPLAITYGQDSCLYPYGINGGVWVVKPSKRFHKGLDDYVHSLDNADQENKRRVFGQSDQSMMRNFMKDERDGFFKGHDVPVLSHIYNMNMDLCVCDGISRPDVFSQVLAWHMIGPKPWDTRDRLDRPCEREVRKLWWEHYDKVALEFRKPA